MLDKAVATVIAEKRKTLDLINKGEGDSLTAISMCFAATSATAKALPLAILTQGK